MVNVTSLLAKAGSGLTSVLESELGQKWRYGALKACIGKVKTNSGFKGLSL